MFMSCLCHKFITFFIFLIISCAAMFFSAHIIATHQAWYLSLKLPYFSPPSFVFSIVWPILYLCMAIAATLLWHSKKNKYRAGALTFWFCQLIFNIIFPLSFFSMQEIFLSILCLMIYWICLMFCIILAFKVKATAAWLLIPNILWISFALLLTYAIFQKNPHETNQKIHATTPL